MPDAPVGERALTLGVFPSRGGSWWHLTFGGTSRSWGSHPGRHTAEIAEATFDRIDTALLARSGDFPDALAASGLAGAGQAPIVLNPNDETMTNRTAQALENLDVQRVTILGGTQAVGEDTEQWLEDHGYQPVRVAGADRYGTAAEAARTIGTDQMGRIDGQRTVFVAYGGRFPDALAAGSVA